MSREADEFINLRRRSKNNKSHGSHLYFSDELMCKALTHAGIGFNEPIKAKATASKGRKGRATIVVNIYRADELRK